MRILVVEDDPIIASVVSTGLESQHYAVDWAADGVAGHELATVNDYDTIILDVMLPKRDGIELCRMLRSEGISTPVLLLTSLSEDGDVVRGLDSGADDFLTKPISFEVLLARVRALLRRATGVKKNEVRFGSLVLNTSTRSVTRDGQPLDLTAKELMLLEYLMLHAGRVVTRDMIAEHVWDMNYDPRSNVIDRLVHRLRQKVEADGSPYLRTVRGLGYALRQD